MCRTDCQIPVTPMEKSIILLYDTKKILFMPYISTNTKKNIKLKTIEIPPRIIFNERCAITIILLLLHSTAMSDESLLFYCFAGIQ